MTAYDDDDNNDDDDDTDDEPVMTIAWLFFETAELQICPQSIDTEAELCYKDKRKA